MSKQRNLDTTIRIPVITDLVRPGNPEVIRRARAGISAEYQQHFERRLKERIAELQEASGQDEYTGLARAHAIRSEHQEDKVAPQAKDYEQQIDQRRHELLNELSSMLK